MEEFLEKVRSAMTEIATVMARLRAPGGCPWDREQTLESLKPYVIEEAYEVLEAIENGDSKEHCEELGDLLMQVVFQAEVQREAGKFDLSDVAHAIASKLVRRHPHVFGNAQVSSTGEVLDNWEAFKKKEKAGRGALDGVPRALPGLIRALRMGEKAARTGFDFADAAQALGKVHEEVGELAAAKTHEEKTHELGDALFALVNVARKEGIDPEEALRGTLDRFHKRFAHVEKATGDEMRKKTPEELDRLWQEAKRLST